MIHAALRAFCFTWRFDGEQWKTIPTLALLLRQAQAMLEGEWAAI
jgi:hypothetical protein